MEFVLVSHTNRKKHELFSQFLSISGFVTAILDFLQVK